MMIGGQYRTAPRVSGRSVETPCFGSQCRVLRKCFAQSNGIVLVRDSCDRLNLKPWVTLELRVFLTNNLGLDGCCRLTEFALMIASANVGSNQSERATLSHDPMDFIRIALIRNL